MLTGALFPFPTFIISCAFAIGRILHQVGYSSGYGAHGVGFMVTTLATVTMEGLCALVALAGCGLVDVGSAYTSPPLSEGSS